MMGSAAERVICWFGSPMFTVNSDRVALPTKPRMVGYPSSSSRSPASFKDPLARPFTVTLVPGTRIFSSCVMSAPFMVDSIVAGRCFSFPRSTCATINCGCCPNKPVEVRVTLSCWFSVRPTTATVPAGLPFRVTSLLSTSKEMV